MSQTIRPDGFIKRQTARIGRVISILLLTAASALAQNVEFTQNSGSVGLDVSLQIPLKVYPGRGEASMPVTLYYSSKVWRIKYKEAINRGQGYYDTILEAVYAEHSASGWTNSLSVPKIEWPEATETYNFNGQPICQPCGSTQGAYRIRRVYIHMPDGSTHELRKSDVAYAGEIDKYGTFYAVDGSRLRYDSTTPYTGTLYLPDGTQYIFSHDANGTPLVRYIDRNGNTLIYSGATGQWTDTVGRTLTAPPVNSYAATYPGDYAYSLPGIGGAPVTYTFRWRRLKNLSTGESALTDPTQSLRYVSDTSPSLFTSYDNGETVQTVEPHTLFNPVVLTEIAYPNGTSYKFSYNIYGEIDKVISPTGGYERYQYVRIPSLGHSSEPYAQTNRGIASRWVSPSGTGTDEAQWTIQASVPSPGSYLLKTTAPDGTRTEKYLHNIIPAPFGNSASIYDQFGYTDALHGLPYDERVYAPAAQGGAMLRRTLTQWDKSSTTNPSPFPITGSRSYTATRNPRPVRKTSITLDTGSSALATTTTFTYDATYQFDVGLEQTASRRYDYVALDQATAQGGAISSIPQGALLVTTQTTYLTSDANYRGRNILGLPTSTTILNAAGATLARMNMSYDEPSYPLIPYGSIVGWTDPGTTWRGNLTTTARWINTSNSYLLAHTQYDQCGNVKIMWDGRGNRSEVNYADSFSDGTFRNTFAYPTGTTSPVPDPSGTHGSNSPLTTSTIYDFSTGAVTSTTDANGQAASVEYNDVLNRPTKVTRPDGGWTITQYGDTPGNLYINTKSTLDAGRILDSYQFYDGLGRPSRSFQDEGATWLVSDIQYDQLGRVSRVSNPYRSTQGSEGPVNPSNRWTTSSYDALGRLLTVTTPDNVLSRTAYSGSTTTPLGSVVTVTDQAGKSRKSITDALGRTVQVIEDPNGLNYQTNYTYDLLGNLIHIAQGSGQAVQHRYFKYDSLSRLTYERQVEAKTAPFTASDALTGNSTWSRRLVYDAPGSEGLLTDAYDARNIKSHFDYDALGRVWRATYSDGSTPTVTSTFDRARAGYQNLGRVTEIATAATASLPATSQAYDYDLMGRVKEHKQAIVLANGTRHEYPTRYTYNIGGQLISQTYPSGREVYFNYDDAARLKGVAGSGGRTYAGDLQYEAHGGLTSLTFGNGAIETVSYNNRLQLSTLSLTKNSATLQRYDYKYGQVNADTGAVDETKNNGQIARIEGYIGAQKQWQQRFSYDAVGRLSSAGEYRGDNSQLSYRVNYDYDPFGNRYQFQARNPISTNPLPYVPIEDADINKLTNRFNSGVTYDDSGRITVDNKFRGMQYQYDANGRQKWAAYTDGTGAVTSVYDGTGQRVATMVNGAVTNYFAYDAFGKLLAEYGTTSQPETSGTTYIFSDHEGSPRVVLNSSGTGSSAVLARHDYQPYGADLQAGVGLRTEAQGYGSADSIRQKYAGMEEDDGTGLAHTLWRKYDSSSGRWTSPDPYGGSISIFNPQSFNRYAYVNNDPVNLTDPLGLVPASQGWSSVADNFWGGSIDFNSPHFGGPGIISEAEAIHDDLVKEARALDAFNKAWEKGDYERCRQVLAENPSVGWEEERGGDVSVTATVDAPVEDNGSSATATGPEPQKQDSQECFYNALTTLQKEVKPIEDRLEGLGGRAINEGAIDGVTESDGSLWKRVGKGVLSGLRYYLKEQSKAFYEEQPFVRKYFETASGCLLLYKGESLRNLMYGPSFRKAWPDITVKTQHGIFSLRPLKGHYLQRGMGPNIPIPPRHRP